MNILILLTLCLGIITSYDDIELGIVKNRNLIIFLVLGIIAYIFIFAFSGSAVPGNSYSSIGNIVLNAFMGLLVGYILWKAGAWPPGDAKLFALYTFLVPLQTYQFGYIPYFPAFSLLVNVFFAGVVWAAFMMITYAARNLTESMEGTVLTNTIREWWANLQKDFPRITATFVGFLIIFSFVRLLSSTVFEQTGKIIELNVFIFIMLFIAFRFLNNLMSDLKKFYLYIPLTIGYVVFRMYHMGDSTDVLLSDFISTIKSTIAFILISNTSFALFNRYIESGEISEVTLENLESGMVVSEAELENLKEYDEIFKNIKNGELNDESVRFFKEYFTPHSKFRVYKKSPLAPIMFGGAILTMAIKQSVVHLIIVWLKTGKFS